MTFDLPRPTGRAPVPPSASWAGGAWRGLLWILGRGNEARKNEPVPMKLGRETNDSIVQSWFYELASRGGRDLVDGPLEIDESKWYEAQEIEQSGGLFAMTVKDWRRDP